MAAERPGPSRLLTGAFLIAALLVGAALGAQEMNGLASPLDRIENLTLDWRFLLAGARPAPSSVVIVAIDDETLSEAGSGVPTREMMARLVRALAAFHPRSVAIDIAFLNPRNADVDAELANALKAGPAVVAAIGNFDASTLQPGQPNRAIWRWRRSRPPFSGQSTRSAMRRKWDLPMFQPIRAECLATFR
jgi:adenylate cyclase